MIRAVSSETHVEGYFPHGRKQQVFEFWSHAQSLFPLSLGPWRYKEKMATPEQKAFCVLQIGKCESVFSLQRAFRRQLQSDPPSANRIMRWYQQFQTTECLCTGKSAGRPRVSEETVELVRQSFLCSLKKSSRHACRELEMSTMSVWRAL
jgi:hypothetical protein